MKAVLAIGLLGLAEALGSCHLLEEDGRPIPERVIRIEIEGCKEAAPVAVVVTSAIPTLVPSSSPAATRLVTAEPAPVVPFDPGPSTEMGKQLKVNNLRDQIVREMRRKSLSLLDLPEVSSAQSAALAALGQGNYDEALRQLTAAESELRRVSVDRPFVSQRLDRVKGRLEAKKGHLAGNYPPLEREWQDAENLFMQQRFEQSNEKLDDLDSRLDALALESSPSRH